jgi:hypothetical protein
MPYGEVLLGYPRQLKIVNGNSDPAPVTTNYTQLISQDHVNFTFGPFCPLLTAPAAEVAARYHYTFPEGAGGVPSVSDPQPPGRFTVGAPLQASEGPKSAAIGNPRPARGKGLTRTLARQGRKE